MLETYGLPVIRLLGIDPGSNALGLAKIDYDVRTSKIIHANAWTSKTDRLPMGDMLGEDAHGERFIKIRRQKENLRRVLENLRPNIVCCETPFFNMLRPSAFAPLVETLYAIREVCFEYNPSMDFIAMAPKVIKATLGANANADKPAMLAQFKKVKETMYCPVDLDRLDEHAIDALATVISFIKRDVE